MSLTSAVFESLPYIDTEPTPSERAAAEALINAELPPPSAQETHPSLPDLPPHHLTPLIEAEHLRIESKIPLRGIDSSRYEFLEPPTTTPHSDKQHPETLRLWREALAKAYTSHVYVSDREINLHLLDEFGKNAWLISNSQLEDMLRALERELVERKTEIDLVVIERKNAQESVGGELKGLEEAWKRGVGRVLETEVAAEGLRREILERRRGGAS